MSSSTRSLRLEHFFCSPPHKEVYENSEFEYPDHVTVIVANLLNNHRILELLRLKCFCIFECHSCAGRLTMFFKKNSGTFFRTWKGVSGCFFLETTPSSIERWNFVLWKLEELLYLLCGFLFSERTLRRTPNSNGFLLGFRRSSQLNWDMLVSKIDINIIINWLMIYFSTSNISSWCTLYYSIWLIWDKYYNLETFWMFIRQYVQVHFQIPCLLCQSSGKDNAS